MANKLGELKSYDGLILKNLKISKDNLIASGQESNQISLLILTLLKLINSGEIEGEVKFRINGHVVSDPTICSMKLDLKLLKYKLEDEKPILKIQ